MLSLGIIPCCYGCCMWVLLEKISDASASNNDGTGASSSLSGNNDDEVANDNTPLV